MSISRRAYQVIPTWIKERVMVHHIEIARSLPYWLKEMLPSTLLVLVADPNPLVCHTMTEMLRAVGHAASGASTIVAGLQLLDAAAFDAMIISIDRDPSMMDMTFLRAARRKHPSIRIIGTSAYHDEPSKPTLEAVDCFMRKPFTLEQLAAAIGDAVADCATLKERANWY